MMGTLLLSLLGIGGGAGLLGAAAIVFPAFGALLGGWLKGAWAFVRQVPWQVWAGLVLAAVLAFLIISRSHWIDRAKADETELAAICQVTRSAAVRPHLSCKQVPLQIRYLGEDIAKLKGAIADQNRQIDAWKAEAARQQALAAEIRRQADKRAATALGTVQKLKASAAKPLPPGAPCEPSKTLQEAWQ